MRTFKPNEPVDLIREVYGDDPDVRQRIRDLTLEYDVAQLVYDLRTARNLTQAEFAKLVGTTQPVISRLEDANYTGHSLKLLRRIAQALGLQLQIAMVPSPKASRKKSATTKPVASRPATPRKRRAA